MWKQVRILILLLILLIVAVRAWHDRVSTTSWHDSLWVGIYPINGDDSDAASGGVVTSGPKSVVLFHIALN